LGQWDHSDSADPHLVESNNYIDFQNGEEEYHGS
jgi:hypothetical protein